MTPDRLWAWLEAPARARFPNGLSRGEEATLYVGLFAATLGVMVFAATLGYAGCFLVGMGWMIVLDAIGKWERSLEGEPWSPQPAVSWAYDSARPVTILETLAPRVRVREDYKLNHDVRDVATLPCRYGCKEPVTCPFPHSDCPHCLDARDAAALMARADGR